MPQKTPSVVIEDVIRKYLYGMKQDEIAKTTGTSEANVSNIIREFKTTIDQKDMEGGVTLMRALTAKNISHGQIISAVRAYSIMQQLGLDIDDKSTDAFLSGIYKEAKSNGIEPKILVETATQMYKLKPHDMPLENIPKYYEDLLAKTKSAEEKLEELEKDLAQKEEQKIRVGEELQTKLEERKTTLDTLEEYNENKKSLENKGVSIGDIPKISNMIKQASASGYDVSTIIRHTSKEGTFEERQSQLEENIERLSKQEQSLEKKIKELKGIVESIELNIQDLEKTAGQLQHSIDILQYLEKNGINPTQIIQWGRILKLSGIELQQFEDDLQKFTSITNYIENKKSRLEALKKEITSLKSRVKTLTNEKTKLEAHNDEVQKTTIKSLKMIENNVINSISNVVLSSKESIRSISGETEEKLKKISGMTHEELQNLISALCDFIARTAAASEEIGRVEILRPISDIINGSEWNPREAYPVLISVLEKFKKQMVSQKADSSMIRSVESLIGYLKIEERRIGIVA